MEGVRNPGLPFLVHSRPQQISSSLLMAPHGVQRDIRPPEALEYGIWSFSRENVRKKLDRMLDAGYDGQGDLPSV